MSDINYVKLTWDMIDQYCMKISDAIIETKKIPDMIIAIGRGGLIPARIISDRLNVKSIYMYNIKLYTGVNQRLMKPKVENFNVDTKGKSLLLIDDIMDSGQTINAVIEDILSKSPNYAAYYRVATLLCKKDVIRKPTFFAQECNNDDWIIFPWEKEEFSESRS